MNIKIKYKPKKRSIQLPLVFVLLFAIIVAPISLGVQFNEEVFYLFYIQEALFLVILLLYLSLIVGPGKPKRGIYEALLKESSQTN
jgi:hypothetical protein